MKTVTLRRRTSDVFRGGRHAPRPWSGSTPAGKATAGSLLGAVAYQYVYDDPRASGQGKQSLTFYGQAFTTKTTTYGDAGVPNVNDTANVFNFDQATLDASAAAQGFPVASPNPQSTFAQAWGK